MRSAAEGGKRSLRAMASFVLLAALALPAVPAAPAGAADAAQPGGRADDPWLDYAWQCRRAVTISGAGAAAADCQVFFNLTYDADMRPDFGDIRFVQFNGTSGRNQELPYYIEQKTDRVKAQLAVKVPEIKAGATTIYLY